MKTLKQRMKGQSKTTKRNCIQNDFLKDFGQIYMRMYLLKYRNM